MEFCHLFSQMGCRTWLPGLPMPAIGSRMVKETGTEGIQQVARLFDESRIPSHLRICSSGSRSGHGKSGSVELRLGMLLGRLNGQG